MTVQPRVDPRVQAACEEQLAVATDLAEHVAVRLRREEPIYVNLMDLATLMQAVRPNIVGLLESVRLDATQALAAPRDTGRRRAEQGVPLAAVLHGYRLGAMHVWDELVVSCERMTRDEVQPVAGPPGRPDGRPRGRSAGDALLRSAAALWTALDVYSQELATAYRDVESEQVQRDERLRQAALAALFRGTPGPHQTVADIAALLRLPASARFVVVATDPRTADDGAAVRSAERALAALGARCAWRSEADAELGLVALADDRRLDRVVALLEAADLGRVGVSETFAMIASTPRAVSQALLARDTASQEARCVHYRDARVAALLRHHPEVSAGLCQDVLGPVLTHSAEERSVLLGTLRAWYDAAGSTDGAAELLHCHANTVRYRLNKLSQLTGRSLKDPRDVIHLYLALEAHRLVRAAVGATVSPA